MGALLARRRFAVIAGSIFCTESYPLLESSQLVGATAVVTIKFLEKMLIFVRLNCLNFMSAELTLTELPGRDILCC